MNVGFVHVLVFKPRQVWCCTTQNITTIISYDKTKYKNKGLFINFLHKLSDVVGSEHRIGQFVNKKNTENSKHTSDTLLEMMFQCLVYILY